MAALAPDSHRITRLGEYAILRVVGEGGMGIVYEASERLSGRRVALKVLHSSLSRHPGARERFFAEMRIMAGLEHPNIVTSLASLEIEGKLVMVLEYLEGRNLRSELELSGRIPASRAITIAAAVAAALIAAHGAKPAIVHRDLKPENLMLARDGRIKVMDFGVAKVLGDGSSNQTTQAVGTVQYMSPEQAGGGVISPKTDLYALGLLIYEMLTGRPPFESPSLLAILRHHCETPVPPLPDDVRQAIPLELEQLLFDLLEKDPAARPADAHAVLARLISLQAPAPAGQAPAPRASEVMQGARTRAAISGHTAAGHLDTVAIIERLEKRSRWPYWLAGGALLAALAVTAGLLIYRTPSSRSRSQSESDETEEEAPAPVPSNCPVGAACAFFAPPNPRAMTAEAIIAEADKLARRADPSALLNGASFVGAVFDGSVDLTQNQNGVIVTYRINGGLVIVIYGNGQLTAHRTLNAPNAEPALAGVICPLKSAWAASGLRAEPRSNATLAFNPIIGKNAWTLSNGKDSVLIDAQACRPHTGRR